MKRFKQTMPCWPAPTEPWRRPESPPCCVRWDDCPALAGQDLGTYTQTILGQEIRGSSQDLAGSLHLARRGFWEDRTCDHMDACGALWDALTKGADLS